MTTHRYDPSKVTVSYGGVQFEGPVVTSRIIPTTYTRAEIEEAKRNSFKWVSAMDPRMREHLVPEAVDASRTLEPEVYDTEVVSEDELARLDHQVRTVVLKGNIQKIVVTGKVSL